MLVPHSYQNLWPAGKPPASTAPGAEASTQAAPLTPSPHDAPTFSALPTELLEKIGGELDTKSFAALGETSRRMHAVLQGSPESRAQENRYARRLGARLAAATAPAGDSLPDQVHALCRFLSRTAPASRDSHAGLLQALGQALGATGSLVGLAPPAQVKALMALTALQRTLDARPHMEQDAAQLRGIRQAAVDMLRGAGPARTPVAERHTQSHPAAMADRAADEIVRNLR